MQLTYNLEPSAEPCIVLEMGNLKFHIGWKKMTCFNSLMMISQSSNKLVKYAVFSYWAQTLFFFRFLRGWYNQNTTFMQTHTQTPQSPLPLLNTISSLPHASCPTLMSHFRFHTALCLLSLSVSVYNSLSTSYKTYCFSFSFCHFVLFCFPLHLFSLVPHHPVNTPFLSCLMLSSHLHHLSPILCTPLSLL